MQKYKSSEARKYNTGYNTQKARKSTALPFAGLPHLPLHSPFFYHSSLSPPTPPIPFDHVFYYSPVSLPARLGNEWEDLNLFLALRASPGKKFPSPTALRTVVRRPALRSFLFNSPSPDCSGSLGACEEPLTSGLYPLLGPPLSSASTPSRSITLFLSLSHRRCYGAVPHGRSDIRHLGTCNAARSNHGVPRWAEKST